MQVFDCPEQREDLLQLITGFSTGLVNGMVTSSPGSSARNFCFLARCVMARMLEKQCRTTDCE